MSKLKTGDRCRMISDSGLKLRGRIGEFMGRPFMQTRGGKRLYVFVRGKNLPKFLKLEELRKLPPKPLKEEVGRE